VANDDGRPSLTRLGAIVEQIAELVNSGVEVVFVSSGAVGMGKRLLRKQNKLTMSIRDIQGENGHLEDAAAAVVGGAGGRRSTSFVSLLDVNERPHTLAEKKKFYDSACAAAGQFEVRCLAARVGSSLLRSFSLASPFWFASLSS